MEAEIPQDEMQSFYDFLGQRLQNGGANLTPEESVREFRAYQAELARFRQTVALAREQGANGLSKPLDVDALMERVSQRLAAQNGNQ